MERLRRVYAFLLFARGWRGQTLRAVRARFCALAWVKVFGGVVSHESRRCRRHICFVVDLAVQTVRKDPAYSNRMLKFYHNDGRWTEPVGLFLLVDKCIIRLDGSVFFFQHVGRII